MANVNIHMKVYFLLSVLILEIITLTSIELIFEIIEMEHTEGKNVHFRHLLYFGFRRGLNTAETIREICTIYGEDVISERTGRRWFAKFKNGDIGLDDANHSGRPSYFDEGRLMTLLKEDQRQTTRELAKEMNCGQTTIVQHLNSLGYTQKIGSWVPHLLTNKNKEKRLAIAGQNLARHRATRGHNDRFLHRIVTGDEKWCLYVNTKERKAWTGPGETSKPRTKPDLHPNKRMICVW